MAIAPLSGLNAEDLFALVAGHVEILLACDAFGRTWGGIARSGWVRIWAAAAEGSGQQRGIESAAHAYIMQKAINHSRENSRWAAKLQVRKK
jgi:hypothetical protein